MTPLVQLAAAGVSLGGRSILRDIEFSLDSGQVAGISGPNGSGKTTLLRAIASLTRLDDGQGSLLGADMRSNEVYAVRRSVTMIGHIPALIGQLTLAENLKHAASLRGDNGTRIDRALEVVGLSDAAAVRADASSFGTQRRLEVARAILTDPEVLLLDEAFSGLDSAAQSLVDALVSRTTANGGGVVMVSHDAAHLGERASVDYTISAGLLEAAV